MTSRRMTSDAFLYLQKNFLNQFNEMEIIEILIDRFSFFRIKSRRKKKTNEELYGEKLSIILAWLDENCQDLYFPKYYDSDFKKAAIVTFYFMESSDAMAFKLMFED